MSMNEDIENEELTGGKISVGASGLGTPSPEDVFQRAKELALIDGFENEKVDQRYLDRAIAELTGVETGAEDVVQPVDQVTEWDEAPGSSGIKVPNMGPSDDQIVPQKLVEEGVAEALHDQMVEATEDLNREESGIEEA
jgi:hypothetical protein